MDWIKIEKAVRRAIDEREARDAEQRARVYAAARAALGRRQDADENVFARFDALAKTIEATYASEPAGLRGRKWPAFGKWGAIRQWSLLAAGIVIGVGGFLFVDAVTVNSISADKMDTLRKSYKTTLPQVQIAVGFLHEVADAIIKAQAGDRKKLDATSKFVSLANFDPALAKKMPSSLPKGSAIILKADTFNFKILFNWPMCGTVSVSDPAMVDPVRAVPNTIGCPYFGLWTPAASNW